MKENKWRNENAVADFEVDCVLVTGQMPTEEAEKKSFQLYRKNSHSVRIVTFDEILGNLKQLLGYLKEDHSAQKTSEAKS
jgi:hypothetical protein